MEIHRSPRTASFELNDFGSTEINRPAGDSLTPPPKKRFKIWNDRHATLVSSPPQKYLPACQEDDEYPSGSLRSEGSLSRNCGRDLPNDPNLRERSFEGWAKVARILQDLQVRKVKDCKEDMDTLLVFVSNMRYVSADTISLLPGHPVQSGLFSAVLTAFNVESFKLLRQDTGDLTAQILLQMSLQLSGLSANTSVPLITPFVAPAFKPSTSAIIINILWFTSLVFSVITASVGILVKQQLRKIRADDPRSNAPVRRQVWIDGPTLFRIAGVLPLLMQLSLVLFLVGLMLFLISLNNIVATVLVNIIGYYFLILLAVTLTPTRTLRSLRESTTRIASLVGEVIWHLPLTFCCSRRKARDEFDDYTSPQHRKSALSALVGAAVSSLDDDFLATVRQCLSDADPEEVYQCIRQILKERYDLHLSYLSEFTTPMQRRLTKHVTQELENIVMDLMERVLNAGKLLPWQCTLEEGMSFLVLLRSPKLPSLLVKMIGFHKRYAERVVGLLDRYGWPLQPDVTNGQEFAGFLGGAVDNLRYKSLSNPTKLCEVVLDMTIRIDDTALRDSEYDLRSFFSELSSSVEETPLFSPDLAPSRDVPESTSITTKMPEMIATLESRVPGIIPDRLKEFLSREQHFANCISSYPPPTLA